MPWAFAMDTPYRWVKQVASHLGGTRTGMVMTWPKRITDRGGIRNQFHHVIDIAPTILDEHSAADHGERHCPASL